MITRIFFLQPKASPPSDGGIAHGIEISLNNVVGLERIQKTIPGVITIQAGRRINRPDHDFQYGIVARFVDSESAEAFETHKQVEQIFTRLRELCEKIIAMDLPDFTLAFPSDFQFPEEPYLDPRVKEVVIQALDLPDNRLVTAGASLYHELNVFTVDGIYLLTSIQDAFHITISDEDFFKFNTVGDIQAYLKQQGVL
jgi:acyl carrier protein